MYKILFGSHAEMVCYYRLTITKDENRRDEGGKHCLMRLRSCMVRKVQKEILLGLTLGRRCCLFNYVVCHCLQHKTFYAFETEH